ncbi:MAG TPA: hypothetical protein VFC86_13150 [Planctomycetota bacterium]|nr:hypothetical protein [Planctomycetota bacterium]
MRRSKHFILGVVTKGDEHVRLTRGERFVVQGGTKESHEQAADFVAEIDREYVKDPPQTDGERRLIVQEAARKTGLLKSKER